MSDSSFPNVQQLSDIRDALDDMRDSLLTRNIFTERLGEVQVNPTANTLLARLKTIADNQLGDGHNVTIDNISTNEVYVRGSGTAGSADAAVLTVQGIVNATPVVVTESSPISGFATSAKQLTDNHNVVVTSAPTTAVTGIFWQTTQPVSGTVTANAGTNLNTSALLTESVFTGRLGEVQASPTSNTVLARLKTIADNQQSDALTNTELRAGDVKVSLDSEEVTVNLKPLSSIGNGQNTVTTAGTREVLANSTAIKSVTIKALSGNTNDVYVGDSGVTSANGFILDAGDTVSLDVDNLADVYIDVDTDGEGVSFIYVS